MDKFIVIAIIIAIIAGIFLISRKGNSSVSYTASAGKPEYKKENTKAKRLNRYSAGTIQERFVHRRSQSQRRKLARRTGRGR